MDIQKLIDDYLEWLKKGFTFEKIGEFYEITTPYLDNYNDCLQIYVKQDKDDILFTDDGATLNGLMSRGFSLKAELKNEIKRLLYPYGVRMDGNELTIKSSEKDFPFKKHLFLQAIIHINDVYGFPKEKGHNSSRFIDDVQTFFNQNDIFCSDNVQFTGKTGFNHNYDFLFTKTKNKPERLCQTLNLPNKSNTFNILFSWDDTKATRKNDSELIIILNDNNSITKGVEEAFQTYQAHVIFWSERKNKNNIELLSA